MQNIMAAIDAPARVPTAPPFNFNLTEAAAVENFKVLSDNNMDLDKIIRSSAFSPISYGSEFKDSSLLEPIFSKHPHWLKMKNILDNGSSFPLEEISDQDRLGDLQGAIAKGNHKSASDEREPILTRKMAWLVRPSGANRALGNFEMWLRINGIVQPRFTSASIFLVRMGSRSSLADL